MRLCIKAAARTTVVLGVAVFIFGCPHRPPDLDPQLRIDNPTELLEAVRDKGKQLTALRATGSIVMRRGAKRLKAHILVLVRRPANLRFETESFFDQPLSILVTDGMQFSMWDMNKGRFLVGQATPANISRVIPIPMDGPEVVGIMAGDPPLIAYAKSSLKWDDSEGQYLLRLSNSQMEQEILIHPFRLRPSKVICKQDGKLYYSLVYEDWQTGDNQPAIPTKMRFEMPAEDIKLIIKIRETEINPELADDLFKLHPPEGISVERVVSGP